MLDLTPDQLLTTTRSVRKRLDFDRPVDRALLEECLEIAMQAPTGSNMQNWHWVVIEDPAKKRAVADLYRAHWDVYSQLPGYRAREGDTRYERNEAVKSSAGYLAEHLHEAPYLVLLCGWGRLPHDVDNATAAGFWGSIAPAGWSFMLALRARGLGSAWTSLHLKYEREVAEILGIPYERVTQCALFPVAWTKGTDFKPAPRQPLSEVLHWDMW